ncbi:hypothetical protein PROFUN_15249, partial [Planoprotostelium fungivorum]
MDSDVPEDDSETFYEDENGIICTLDNTENILHTSLHFDDGHETIFNLSDWELEDIHTAHERDFCNVRSVCRLWQQLADKVMIMRRIQPMLTAVRTNNADAVRLLDSCNTSTFSPTFYFDVRMCDAFVHLQNIDIMKRLFLKKEVRGQENKFHHLLLR